MRRLSRSLPSTLCLHTHAAKRDYVRKMYFSQDDMLSSEPEFDPSSKEINIFVRRDASIAMIARLLSVFQ